MMTEELRNKVAFVRNLSDTIITGVLNVEYIDYEIYENSETECITEFLVFHFKGGAISVRVSNMNSCWAILQDIARHCGGGYYDEVRWYTEDYVNNDKEVKIS